MIGIDLFSGAGGMSLGASLAGVDVIAAVESNKWAAETYRHNHGVASVLAKRIEHVRKQDFPPIPRGRSLVIFGGPPCRGFSTSNQKTRTSRNPDNWLFLEYLRLVRELSPDWVVFENVPGILQTEEGKFINEVLSRLDKLRYRISTWVLNAVDFGIPQRRSRLFVIGSRGARIEPPSGSNECVTVYDAISDLPRLSNGASINYLPYRGLASSSYALQLRGKLKQSSNHLVTRNHPRIIRRYSFVPPESLQLPG
jgi:DNA (cytosine-5)-methyltransferase 1